VILAFLFALAQSSNVEPAEARLFRLGEETHLLKSHLHDRFFGNADFQKRLTGAAFEKACAAHFLALRKVEPRYATEFRPSVVEAMQSVIPPERLAVARISLGHDPNLVAWKSRVHDEIKRRAAGLLNRAGRDYDREIEIELVRVDKVALPAAENVDRAKFNEPQLAIACATYFGNNRSNILTLTSGGERG